MKKIIFNSSLFAFFVANTALQIRLKVMLVMQSMKHKKSYSNYCLHKMRILPKANGAIDSVKVIAILKKNGL